MTTPKMPGKHAPADGLDDTINELDGLITGKSSVPQNNPGVSNIPVLDEIIEDDNVDYIDDMEMLLDEEQSAEALPSEKHISHEQLDIIIGNVEEKIANELDTLVNILKDTIKDSIMTEIKTQIGSSLSKSKTEKPDSNSS